MAGVLIGSHVHQDDPLAAAQADGADVVQFFLGNPQSWKKPKPSSPDGSNTTASAFSTKENQLPMNADEHR